MKPLVMEITVGRYPAEAVGAATDACHCYFA